jgi:hypothetical protein
MLVVRAWHRAVLSRVFAQGVSWQRTHLFGGCGLCLSHYTLYSLVHSLKHGIAVRLELAHHAAIGELGQINASPPQDGFVIRRC